MTMNPFTTNTNTLTPSDIIDRDELVGSLVEVLRNKKQNVLLIGDYGIGKTCVLKKLREKLLAYYSSDILMVQVDMLARTLDPTEYLLSAINALFQEAAKSVFGLKYSMVLQSLNARKNLEERMTPHLRNFLDLFRLVRPADATYSSEDVSQFGTRIPVVAQKRESKSKAFQTGPLHVAEFIEITRELLANLNTKGIQQIIFFGDEANHIDTGLQVDLLRTNIEAFSDQGAQFVFAVDRRVVDMVPQVKQAFAAVWEVPRFSEKSHMDHLIDDYLAGARASADIRSLQFSPLAREKLWAITSGRPREIQRLCQKAVDLALEGHILEIDLAIILDACIASYEITASVR